LAPRARGLQLTRLAATGLTVFFVLLRFMPGTGWFYNESPDSSWGWGIDVAASRGLVFGRDIIFNYGPYGPAITRPFDPAVWRIIAGGGAILGLALAAGVCGLRRPFAMLLVALLLPIIPVMDAMAFALPLPALLLCAGAPRGKPDGDTVLPLLALVPALAVLPFMKGSFIGTSLLATVTIIIVLCLARRFRLAGAIIVLLAVCGGALWEAVGQKLAALPDFFIGALRIVDGHNDAMSLPGPVSHVVVAVAASIVFIALFLWGGRAVRPASLLVTACGLSGLLFVAFKAGYVREDGHEAITYATLGLMFAMLAAWLSRWPAAVAAVTAILFLIVPAATAWSIENVPSGIVVSLRDEIAGNYRLLTDPAEARREYAQNNDLQPKLPWHTQGSADIYSSQQALLFANATPWAPRPDFQSYNVTTPGLARLNAAHLLGAKAPDNVFFRVEPIDLRLPALEDGLSWPALLSFYDPVAFDPVTDLAWLRRAAADAPPAVTAAPILSSMESVGGAVALPVSAPGLWAHIDIRRSRIGRLVAALWQAPPVQIVLNFADGSQRTYRFIPGMGSAGFLLSPFVASTLDFLRLRGGNDDLTPPARPVSIVLQPAAGGGWAWQRKYKLTLAPIAFPPPSAPYAVYGAVAPREAAAQWPPAGGTCVLDAVNGQHIPAAQVTARFPLNLVGWGVFDLALHEVADHSEIGFLRADNAWFAMPAPPADRDLSGVLHIAPTARPGFNVTATVSHLPPGLYRTYIVLHRGGATRACATPLRINVRAR